MYRGCFGIARRCPSLSRTTGFDNGINLVSRHRPTAYGRVITHSLIPIHGIHDTFRDACNLGQDGDKARISRHLSWPGHQQPRRVLEHVVVDVERMLSVVLVLLHVVASVEMSAQDWFACVHTQ